MLHRVLRIGDLVTYCARVFVNLEVVPSLENGGEGEKNRRGGEGNRGQRRRRRREGGGGGERWLRKEANEKVKQRQTRNTIQSATYDKNLEKLTGCALSPKK